MSPDEKYERLSEAAARVGRAAAWGAAGEVLGLLVSLSIPDSLLPDSVIAHLFGFILAASGGLGLFFKFKTPSTDDLADCLDGADRLFFKGLINEKEHMSIRERCLRKYLE